MLRCLPHEPEKVDYMDRTPYVVESLPEWYREAGITRIRFHIQPCFDVATF